MPFAKTFAANALRWLLVVNAITSIAAAVVLILEPGAIPGAVGINLHSSQNLIVYLLAAAELAIGVLCLLALRPAVAVAIRHTVCVLIIFHIASAVAGLAAMVQGASPLVGWNVAIRVAMVVAFAWFAWSAAASQPTDGTPDDLRERGLHCFCIEATSTPQRVIGLDTNGRLLHRATGGASIAAIRAEGLQVSESQLALLRAYRLLTVDGDRVTTIFPVLGPAEIAEIRAISSRLGKVIAIEIEPQVKAIRRELVRRKLMDSDYAVIFGYALDGLLWDQLKLRGALPDTTLTPQEPFWRGAFWAIYPERVGGAGRNEIERGGIKLAAVWNDSISDRVNKFLKSAKASEWLDILANSSGKTIVLPALAGCHGFPVIIAARGDPLHDPSEIIATKIAQALATTEAGAALRHTVSKTFKREAALIVAHELIWDIAESLVRNGELVRPDVLSTGDRRAPIESALFAVISAGDGE